MNDYELDMRGTDDELPELPSQPDAPPDYGEPDGLQDYDELSARLEQDDFLNADMDLDEYLSYDEYQEQEEPEKPEPVSRSRRERREAPAKKGGLLGLFKKRGKRESQRAEDGAPIDAALGAESLYPDEDFLPDERYESYEDALPDEREKLYTPHSGARGRAEQEARELIASMQSESGGQRERRNSSNYAVDLDELLGIIPEAGEAAPPTGKKPGPEEADEYRYDLDEAMDFDADVKPYRTKKEQYVPDAQPPKIDARFNLGGQTYGQPISYGDEAVDLSAEEDYVPPQQTAYSPSQWVPDYDDPLTERQDTPEPERKKHRDLFGRAKRRFAPKAKEERVEEPEEAEEEEEEISDTVAGPAIYAVDTAYRDAPDESIDPDYIAAPSGMDSGEDDDDDFDGYDDESTRKYRESELYAPPTFKEYLLSILASAWLRLRGTVRGRTAETMNDYEEDLGEELSAADASKYYGSYLRSARYRLRISALVMALLLYISLEMPIPGMMKSLSVDAAFCFGLQALILLLSLDVVTNAVMNAMRLHFGADSLVVVTCLFTGLDALIVALSDTSAKHMPLCAISSAAVVGLLLSSWLSARGLRKATRVPAIGKSFFAVTAENSLEKNEITLLKSLRSIRGFVHRTEEAGPDETLYTRLCPILFALSVLLSLIVMIAKSSYPEFIYILSALLSLTVPFGALLSFSLPFFLGSNRIFKFGAAIAGWSGLCDIGCSKNLILTDRDLFPESAVTIDSVRIFADEDAQKVISYAGSMMAASGCCAAGCFAELMLETNSPALKIDGFEVMPGGGMKGVIDRHVVLCGSTDLMRLMNVRIPFRLTDKTTVLLAIDGILYGIFSLKYEGQPQIRRALLDLMRAPHPPVFAVRDFNVNPEMLHATFDISTDGYDFPPYVERFRLSEPSEDKKDERITAILCNEGLAPLTSVSDIGRSMYLATNINLFLNAAASFAGVGMVFFRFLSTGANPLSSLFLYMLVWTLPVLLVSFCVSMKR